MKTQEQKNDAAQAEINLFNLNSFDKANIKKLLRNAKGIDEVMEIKEKYHTIPKDIFDGAMYRKVKDVIDSRASIHAKFAHLTEHIKKISNLGEKQQKLFLSNFKALLKDQPLIKSKISFMALLKFYKNIPVPDELNGFIQKVKSIVLAEMKGQLQNVDRPKFLEEIKLQEAIPGDLDWILC